MDRLWVGYWMGGATMALSVGIAYGLAPMWFTVPTAIAAWFLLTPIGILIAKRRM
jgi:hypothetical protein